MPHGGYHGTVVMGGNIVQQGYQKPDGSYGIKGGIGDAALNIPVNQSAQTAAEATAAAQAKKKEIEENFPITLTDPDQSKGSFRKGLNLSDVTTTQTVPPSMGFTQTVNPFDADDVRALAMDFDRENQILNNLLIAEQQAKNREGIIRAAQQGVLNASDLTGTTGGPFGLNIPALGATDTTISGIGSVQNPFTGQELPEQVKAREGLTTPQYNTFISQLYDANPEIYQETFPFASGQIASPFIVKALEAAKAAGSGIMGLPGVSELGQMGGDIVGAMLSPLSGLFTGETAKTPKIKYDNQGNIIDIISQAPDGGGDAQEVDKFGNPILPMGQYSSVPEEFMQGFMDSPFYKNVPGGAMISYVTLPDGREIKFGDTGSASQFRQYLESIGVMQPESTEDFKQVKSQPTGLPALADYASMAPQFTGSQYTNQGISPAFLENLRRFYG